MVEFARDLPGGTPGLGTNANTVTPFSSAPAKKRGSNESFRRARRERFERRAQSSQWLIAQTIEDHGREHFAELAPRPATCGWAAGSHVGVRRAAGSPARFSGVQSCASVWSCSCCAAVIRSRRAEEVQQAASWWEQQRGQFLFLSLTVRHKIEDTLQRTQDVLTEAFTAMINGAPWTRFKRRHGVRHFIKAQEVTLSWDNGWHAHLHVLLFVDPHSAVTDLTDDARQAWSDVAKYLNKSGARNRARVNKALRLGEHLKEARHIAALGMGTKHKREYERWFKTRWIEKVVEAGGRRPSWERGVDIRTVRDGNVVALYIAKLQEGDREHSGWEIGHEMTRADIKKGKKESLVPLELLDLDGLTDFERERQRVYWLEYVEATSGRRSMTWSRGLKEAAGIDEKDDDEVMEAEEAEIECDPFIIAIAARHWRAIRDDADVLAQILELVEADRIDEIRRFVPFEYASDAVPVSSTRHVPTHGEQTALRVATRRRNEMLTGAKLAS